MRSHLATSKWRKTRSLLAIPINLESHLAIPFIQQVIRGPIWRPPNSETRDPFWRSPLVNLESHLAIPFIHEKRGPIWRPPNNETRDHLSRSPLIKNQTIYLVNRLTWSPLLAIPFYRLLDVALPDGRV